MDVREKTASEKRLIDADSAKLAVSDYKVFRCQLGGLMDVVEFIDDQPTIDAVPVVRCRECKHWKSSGSKAGNSFSDMEYIGGCEFTNYYRRESDFCSHGELKEGAD